MCYRAPNIALEAKIWRVYHRIVYYETKDRLLRHHGMISVRSAVGYENIIVRHIAVYASYILWLVLGDIGIKST